MFRKLIATAATTAIAATAIAATITSTPTAAPTTPAAIEANAEHDHAGHDHADDSHAFSLTFASDANPGQPLDALTNDIIGSLQTYWGEIYAQNNVAAPNNVNVAYLMPGDSHPLNDNCGGACYRGGGDLIIFEHETARGYFGWGDMAFATVVAHEYAHNVQAEVGLFNTGRTQRSMELMADCFSGNYVAWATNRGMLDASDLDEARYEVYTVGDDADPSHHGTRQERLDAFNTGYNGNPATCTAAY